MPTHASRRRAALLLVGLAGSLLAGLARAQPAVEPQSMETGWRRLARLDLPVPEVSGLVVVDATETAATLLVVSDGARLDRRTDQVHGGLARIEVALDGKGGARCTAHQPVVLEAAGRLRRADPAWGDTVPLDLEALCPLPGWDDHYLLAGETNPEDATDDGANRLYLVRWPLAGHVDRAAMQAYVRVEDLPWDQRNDRFEALAAHPAGEGAWHVLAFKERGLDPHRSPPYVRGLLRRDDLPRVAWDREAGGLPARHWLHEDLAVLASQADACAWGDEHLLVLDRWHRRLHLAEVEAGGDLALREVWDVAPFLLDVPGERTLREPPAPHGRHPGFGRHEAVGVDARGRLWLAADRGAGAPSTCTVLAPEG